MEHFQSVLIFHGSHNKSASFTYKLAGQRLRCDTSEKPELLTMAAIREITMDSIMVVVLAKLDGICTSEKPRNQEKQKMA